MVQLVLFVIIIILATCAASETALKGQLLTFCAESSAWRVSDPCLEACGFPLTATCPSALYLILCPRITSLGHWKMHQNPCLYWLVYSTYSLLHSSLCFLLLLLFLPMLLWSLSREKLLRIVSLIRDIVLGFFCFLFFCFCAARNASTLIPLVYDRILPLNNLKEVKKESVCHKQKWNWYIWFEFIRELKCCYS